MFRKDWICSQLTYTQNILTCIYLTIAIIKHRFALQYALCVLIIAVGVVRRGQIHGTWRSTAGFNC